MKLSELIDGIYNGQLEQRFRQMDISSICCDSRKTEKESLFVALKGPTVDGAQFVPEAIEKGAIAVVVDNDSQGKLNHKNVCLMTVDDTKGFIRKIAQKFYAHTANDVKVIGITGTNGKTTVAYLVESILHEAERSCSVIGTVNYRIGEKVLPAQNTTPGFLDNQQLLSQIAQEGTEYSIMEVSSHALDQGRIDLIDFKTAVLTNLTSDHLDYHKTRDNYFAAKAQLFEGLSADATSVINADDVYGRRLFSKTESQIMTYAIKKNADVMAQDIKLDISGTSFKLVCPEGEVLLRTNLVGDYNVYNILAAASVGLCEKISLEKIRKGIENLKLVPGRLEHIHCEQDYSIIIDYAHTQDALEHVLSTLRAVCDSKIILVFGCGGDRDPTKRPAMGLVASQLADYSIISSDNPRSEDPQKIIDQIVEGFESDHYTVIPDREEAIKAALDMAQKGDTVLITGKGHESVQIFKDRTVKFEERQIIRQKLRC